MIYSDLSVCRLTHNQHSRTCGYWFTVTSRTIAHKAFATAAGLYLWAMQRGLTIPQDLPREGKHGDLADEQHAYCPIIGSYRRQGHMDPEEFDKITPVITTRELDNGDWTEAKITLDPDGLRTVHFLNANVRYRKVFDHDDSKALFD